jgi:hypothetical protein
VIEMVSDNFELTCPIVIDTSRFYPFAVESLEQVGYVGEAVAERYREMLRNMPHAMLYARGTL